MKAGQLGHEPPEKKKVQKIAVQAISWTSLQVAKLVAIELLEQLIAVATTML